MVRRCGGSPGLDSDVDYRTLTVGPSHWTLAPRTFAPPDRALSFS